MKIDYKQYELTIYELALKLSQLLEKSGCQDERLEEIREMIVSHRFSVAVVGEFKRGKSSLINALLGRKVLPSDTRPTTATLNRITYGAAPGAMVEYKDGKTQEIQVEQLAEYVTKLTEHSANQAAKIRQVVVEYPTALCENDVDLIDTPGLQDNDKMTEITVEAIRDMDLAIFTVSARVPVSRTEQDFLVRLLEDGTLTKLVTAVTFIDLVDEEERQELVEYIRQRIREGVLEQIEKKYPAEHGIYKTYHRVMDELEVYPCSAKLFFKAWQQNNMEQSRESGIPFLREELTHLVIANRRNNIVVKSAALIQGIVNTYCEWEPPELTDLKSLESLNTAKKEKLDRCMEELEEQSWQIMENLTEFTSKQERELKDELCRRFSLALSSVTTLNHSSIRYALYSEIKNCFQYVRDNVTIRCRLALEFLVNETTKTLKRYEVNLFKESDIWDFWSGAVCPDFRWRASPLPQTEDYASCEVIESVNSGVGKSTTLYLRQVQDFTFCLDKGIKKLCETVKTRQNEAIRKETQSQMEQLELAVSEWNRRILQAQSIAHDAEQTLENFYHQLEAD